MTDEKRSPAFDKTYDLTDFDIVEFSEEWADSDARHDVENAMVRRFGHHVRVRVTTVKPRPEDDDNGS